MPTVPTVANSVSLADRRLLRAYPRIVKELTDTDDKMDRLELDGFLKLLPGAVERFEASSDSSGNTIEPSVLVAIQSLTMSFGSRNAVCVETETVSGTSNTPDQAVEMDAGVSEPELPNGSDTSQAPGRKALPHNELQAAPGNGGEPGSAQAGPRNPRVRSASRLQGRKAGRRAQQASGEPANDRG